MQKVQHIVRIQRKCDNYILLLVTWRLASQQSIEHAKIRDHMCVRIPSQLCH